MHKIPQKATYRNSVEVVQWTYLTFVGLILIWVVAWLLKLQLGNINGWFNSSLGSFVYWTIAKLLIWICPALWLIRLSGRHLSQIFQWSFSIFNTA